MARFVLGDKSVLLPSLLDDYVGEDNLVRMVDAFVDLLDLCGLGFTGVETQTTGRQSYHPAVLLKRYICGYLNQIHSRCRLEWQTQRNIELKWLLGRLSPDFKIMPTFDEITAPGWGIGYRALQLR